MTASPAPLADTAREIADSLTLPVAAAPSDWIDAIDARVAASCPELSEGDQLDTTNRIIARLNDRLNLGLRKLTLHRPPAAIAPLRDAQWPQDAAAAIALRQALDARLETETPATEELPVLIIASAALRGGLWRPEALLALARCLEGDRLRLEHAEAFAGLAAIDLELTIRPADQRQTNTVSGQELLRWFPDVATLSLIHRWTRRDPAPWQAPATERRLFSDVLELLGRPPAEAPAFARFALSAPAALEAVSAVDLPAAIEAVASGQAPGLSVTAPSWHALAMRGEALTAPPSAAPARCAKSPAKGRRPIAKPPQEDHLRAALDAFDLLRRAHAGSSSRKGSKALADGLHRLQQEHGPDWPAYAAVLGWYRALLASGNKPGTVADYHGKVGRHVLDVFGATDPHVLEPAALRDLFEQVLARSGYADPGFPLQRIAHFASHAQRVHDWPDADLAELGGERPRDHARFVRAAMLPMTVYPEAFAAIRAATGIPAELADCYATAFALTAWGGLRIDEAAGRVVDDLAPDLTVFVHVTRAHGLKSEAARRLVPLALFAPPDIADHVRDFAARRRHAPDPGRDRLLDPGSLLPGDAFDTGEFRRLVDRTLGRMLGIPVRPHDFRHTLISAVQLLFQLGRTDPETVAAVTGWLPEQQDRILRALLGPVPDPGRAPRQLSALAGHREFSPVSGSTYCHLTDLTLGVLIREAGERMPVSRAARLLGIRQTMVRPFAAADGTVRLEDLRSAILDRMRLSRLRPRVPDSAGRILPPPPDRMLDGSLVHGILRDAEGGASEAAIADSFGLPVAQVAAVIREASRRMRTQTAKKGARLPDARGGTGLMPVSRFAADEAMFLGHLLRGAEELPEADRCAWAETVLSRSDRHRQHLRFASAGAAQDWLRLFPAALPARVLVVTISCPQDIEPEAALDAWSKALGKGPEFRLRPSGHATSASASGPGTVAIHRGPAVSGRERRSFATLRLAAFCISVAEALSR